MLAMGLGQKHLADYGSVRSRHDFTQRQLMSCLILRSYLKITYRGLLTCWKAMMHCERFSAMEDKLPHYTTLAEVQRAQGCAGRGRCHDRADRSGGVARGGEKTSHRH